MQTHLGASACGGPAGIRCDSRNIADDLYIASGFKTLLCFQISVRSTGEAADAIHFQHAEGLSGKLDHELLLHTCRDVIKEP